MGSYSGVVAGLNEAQRAALDEPGSACVLAGPGSGKTSVLVLKVAKLLAEDIQQPRGLACLTYATEAVREFEGRLRDIGIRPGARLFTGTVHAFCLSQVLRPFRWLLPPELAYLGASNIGSEAQVAGALQHALNASEINEPPSWWATRIERYRRVVALRADLADDADTETRKVAEQYETYLRTNGIIDFVDVVVGALKLLRSCPEVRNALAAKFAWLVIDEYQDLGLPLHELVMALVDTTTVRIFAVGDPDQSIYGFTGARPELLADLAKRPDIRELRLALNYRSAQGIIDAGLHVLRPETKREYVYAGPTRKAIVIAHMGIRDYDAQAEVVTKRIAELSSEGTLHSRAAVLAPRWGELSHFAEALTRAAIPYRVVKAARYKPTSATQWVEDAARWCAGGWQRSRPRLADLHQRLEALRVRAGSPPVPGKKLGTRIRLFETLRPLQAQSIPIGEWFGKVRDSLGLGELLDPESVPRSLKHDATEFAIMEAELTQDRASESLIEFAGLATDKVILQSIHASKGREYDVVFMVTLEDGIIPAYNRDEREARRLFYVGVTRARSELHLLSSGYFVTSKGKRWAKGASPFIQELRAKLTSAS